MNMASFSIFLSNTRCFRRYALFPLGLLQLGDEAEVVAIIPGKHSCARTEDMGLRAGKMVKMLDNEGKGAILFSVDASGISLRRGMVMKIMVRRIEQ